MEIARVTFDKDFFLPRRISLHALVQKGERETESLNVKVHENRRPGLNIGKKRQKKMAWHQEIGS